METYQHQNSITLSTHAQRMHASARIKQKINHASRFELCNTIGTYRYVHNMYTHSGSQLYSQNIVVWAAICVDHFPRRCKPNAGITTPTRVVRRPRYGSKAAPPPIVWIPNKTVMQPLVMNIVAERSCGNASHANSRVPHHRSMSASATIFRQLL